MILKLFIICRIYPLRCLRSFFIVPIIDEVLRATATHYVAGAHQLHSLSESEGTKHAIFVLFELRRQRETGGGRVRAPGRALCSVTARHWVASADWSAATARLLMPVLRYTLINVESQGPLASGHTSPQLLRAVDVCLLTRRPSCNDFSKDESHLTCLVIWAAAHYL